MWITFFRKDVTSYVSLEIKARNFIPLSQRSSENGCGKMCCGYCVAIGKEDCAPGAH